MEKVKSKEAFNKLKPEVCVFVISSDGNGSANGMIAGWHMKCSSVPPLFAVALSKKGNTQKLIKKSKEFVIAVPNKKMLDAVKLFGSTHGNVVDKFKETKLKTFRGMFVKAPLLKDATINLECSLNNTVKSGDHIIFIGKILASYVDKRKNILCNMKKVDSDRIYDEF